MTLRKIPDRIPDFCQYLALKKICDEEDGIIRYQLWLWLQGHKDYGCDVRYNTVDNWLMEWSTKHIVEFITIYSSKYISIHKVIATEKGKKLKEKTRRFYEDD